MKKILAAALVAIAASLTLAATASADVPRYQLQTGHLVGNVNGGQYIHYYDVTLNPCNGGMTISGIGSIESLNLDETVTATLQSGILDFDALYVGGYNVGYAWHYDGPMNVTGAAYGPNGQVMTAKFTFENMVASDYKNHGQYVKEMGSDVAHSCIGMPIVSAPFEWSAFGSVDSSSPTGSDVSLPIAGTYRIDVFGTWQNGPHYLVDAEFTEQSPGVWADGWPGYSAVDFGDLMVGGQFVNWGAYSSVHAYTYAAAFPAGPLNLTVWDMWGDLTTDGHADNVGSLTYMVTYAGP